MLWKSKEKKCRGGAVQPAGELVLMLARDSTADSTDVLVLGAEDGRELARTPTYPGFTSRDWIRLGWLDAQRFWVAYNEKLEGEDLTLIVYEYSAEGIVEVSRLLVGDWAGFMVDPSSEEIFNVRDGYIVIQDLSGEELHRVLALETGEGFVADSE